MNYSIHPLKGLLFTTEADLDQDDFPEILIGTQEGDTIMLHSIADSAIHPMGKMKQRNVMLSAHILQRIIYI